MHRLLCLSIASSVLLVTARLAQGADVLPAKPNILFILTDDEGWTTLGCYGNKLVPTPNLDRLAAEGMRFTDAYVTPQCTPTRAALLTGQQNARNGMWHVIPWYGYPWAPLAEPPFVENLPRETFTIAKGLKAAGYATAIVGKWHLTRNGDGDYTGLKPEAAAHYGFDFSPAPPAPSYQGQGDKGVDWLTDQAASFIEKNRGRAWFVYLAHHTVHGPLSAPEALVRKYSQKGAPEKGLNNATFLAMLEHMDNSIGRLMGRLDDLGLRQNTIVVFESDNGGVHRLRMPKAEATADGKWHLTRGDSVFDNAPLREGKGSLYEGGIRVPLIVRWPGQVKPGSLCATPVHVVDWMPTLFQVAGASAPANYPIDGVSIVPLLQGRDIAPRALFWYAPFYELRWNAVPSAVIRDGDWKLIESFGDSFTADDVYVPGRRVELYNLKDDIGETRDLSATQTARRDELLDKLRQWMKTVNASIPAANPDYDPRRPLEETRQKSQSKPN
jgi:arylsulfatase A